MTDRARKRTTKKTHSAILTSGITTVKGKPAFLDTSTGKFTQGGASTTLLPVGAWTENVVGDGTIRTTVDLFEEITLEWLDNDATSPCAADDIGSECYVKDTTTVSMDGTSRSKAGRVWDISTIDGVAVQMGTAVTGPTGASGGLSAGSVATIAALKAVVANDRYTGQMVIVQADRSEWIFAGASTQTVDGANQLVIAPDAGSGRWVRVGKSVVLKLPIDYTLADAAVLLTVPEQMALRLTGMPFWEITTGFTGGSSSAIGVSATAIATTKGDLLGGASGQLTAAIGTAGVKAGTIGPLIDTLAELQAFFLIATNAIRFDRITSIYTAGVGFVHIPVAIAQVA